MCLCVSACLHARVFACMIPPSLTLARPLPPAHRYTCRLPPDYKWGSLENGEWNGIMKEMVSGRADVVVTSLDHNSARAKDVDFVTGLRKVG